MQTRWSLGVLIGAPLVVLAVIVLAGGAGCLLGWAHRHDFTDPFDRNMVRGIASALAVGGMAVAIVSVSPAGYWPFQAEYHQWRPVSGTITQISSRILSDGAHGVNQRFVVQLAGDPHQYGCDDTRCSLLKIGSPVSLSCKREWQYAGIAGYGCNYVSDTLNGAVS